MANCAGGHRARHVASASASRSTWSGSGSHGKKISSSHPACGERLDVLAHRLGVGRRPRHDRVRVGPLGPVVVAQAALDRLLRAVAEGVVRLHHRPRRAVAPGGLPRGPQARGPVGELLQRAVAAGPAVAVARGARERGAREAAEDEGRAAVGRPRADPAGRAELLAIPDPGPEVEHLVEDPPARVEVDAGRPGSRPRGARRPRRARGARPTARRAWRPAWRAPHRWPGWARAGSSSRGGSARSPRPPRRGRSGARGSDTRCGRSCPASRTRAPPPAGPTPAPGRARPPGSSTAGRCQPPWREP